MNSTHIAVGLMREGVSVQARIEWQAGKAGFRLSVTDAEEQSIYGPWDVSTPDALPGETLTDSELDRMVGYGLYPLLRSGIDWATDPVSLAHFYSQEWGFTWVPEKLAETHGKGRQYA